MAVDLKMAVGEQDWSKSTKKDVGVLLLHGLTGMPSEMRPLARHLEKQGYPVSVPLLPGHGAGHKELLSTGWKDWLSGAKKALDELAGHCRQVVVGGLSMGSSLALMLAADDPRVSGLVMLSTTLRYDAPAHSRLYLLLPLIDLCPILGNWFYWTEKPPYGLMDKRLQKMITRAVDAAQKGDSTEFGLFRTYSGSLRQMSLLVKEIKRAAPRVKCPTLLLHSLDDTLTTVANATDMYKLLGCRDKNVILYSGCDHVLTLDLRRDDVSRQVEEFVARVSMLAPSETSGKT